MSCGCFCTCCEFAGHAFSANSSYLGKMPDVNYSEVDFVNCTQDTLPGGRFIQCGTRGVCARLGKRPLGIGLACHKTNKQPTTLALSVNTICKERFFYSQCLVSSFASSFYDDETRSAGEALSSLMKSKQTNMEIVTIITPPGKVKSLQSIAKLPHIQSRKQKTNKWDYLNPHKIKDCLIFFNECFLKHLFRKEYKLILAAPTIVKLSGSLSLFETLFSYLLKEPSWTRSLFIRGLLLSCKYHISNNAW